MAIGETFFGAPGDNTYYGGTGSDTVDYSVAAAAPITVYLVPVPGIVFSTDGEVATEIGYDLLFSIENIIAGDFSDTLFGNDEANQLEGRAGDDTLWGGQGDDTLIGGSGDDFLYGDEGDDLLDGGDGNDSLYTGSWPEGGGHDTMLGGDGNDTLGAANGNNFLYGGNGDDWVGGGTDNDLLDGGDGNDTCHGNSGNDTLYGGLGNDYLDGADGNDYLEGGEGDDTVLGGQNGGSDTLYGNAGDDHINGIDGNDSLIGDLGNDTLWGGQGDDTLNGGSGDDFLYGDEGDDLLDGGDGNDSLYTGSWPEGGGHDTMLGGDGNDTLGAANGNNFLYGGNGDDWVGGGTDNDLLDGGDGNDYLTGNEGNDSLMGELGNDTLWGGQGDDTLNGGSGDDFLYGDEGDDLLDGGDGNDSLYTGSWPEGGGHDTMLGGDGNDTLGAANGNNFLYGGNGDDWVGGGTDNDLLDGGDGNDTLSGGAGNDTLYGEQGDDVMSGGAGNDLITAGAGDNGNDTLEGGSGNDTLEGGAGNDTAVFIGNFADYIIGFDVATSTYTVADKNPERDGTDVVRGVENFQFADVTKTSVDTKNSVDHIYVVTYVVTNTDDSGTGSLRWVLQAVNAFGSDSANTITFAVSGTIVVAPDNPLPLISRPVSFLMDGNTVEVKLENAPVIGGIPTPALRVADKIELSIPANLTITSEGSDKVFALGSSGDLVTGEMAGILHALSFSRAEAGGMRSVRDIHINGDLSGAVVVEATNTALGLYAADNDLQIFGNVSGTVTVTASAGFAAGIVAADHLTITGQVSDTALIDVTGSTVAFGIGGDTGAVDIAGDMAGTVVVTASNGVAYGICSSTDEVNLGSYSGAITATGNTTVVGIGAGINSLEQEPFVPVSSANLTIGGDFSGDVTVTSAQGFAFGVMAANTLTIEGDVTETAAITVTVTEESPDDGVGIGAMNELVITGDMAGNVTVTATQAGGMWAENGSMTLGALSGTINVNGGDFAEGMAAQSVLINGMLSGEITVDASTGDAYGISARSGDITVGGDLSGTVTVSAWNLAYGLKSNQSMMIGTLSGDISATSYNNFAFGLWSTGELHGYSVPAMEPAQPLSISGTISAEGLNSGAIVAGGAMNLSISGTVSGSTTALNGSAFSIISFTSFNPNGTFNSAAVSDQVTVTETGKLVGNVNLGAGNDTLTLRNGADVTGVALLNGGMGIDRLAFGGQVVVDMNVLSGKVRNFEIINLSDGVNNRISLTSSEVGQITDTNHTLYLQGDSLDRVELLSVHYEGTSARDTFQYKENLTLDGIEYAHYTGSYPVDQISFTSQSIDLYIQSDMVVAEYRPWIQYGTSGNDTLAGTWDDDLLYGYGGNDRLSGLGGNDTLDGGSGNDTMLGGAGDDTYIVGSVGDVVTENSNEGSDTVQSSITCALVANVENLILTGSAAIHGIGNAFDNLLFGNSGNNSLTGGAGNDTLNGGAGSDTMLGGVGNDTYVVDNASDVVTETFAAGTDLVQSSVTYTLGANIENLTLTGTDAINGTGNALANILVGNSADNILSGGAGIDTMLGGLGNDLYVVDSASDIVTENINEGNDTVQSSVTYTLGANVETLTLTGTAAINGTGNAIDNLLVGNSSYNILSGGAGNDTMQGLGGNDTYVVESAGDLVIEEASAGTDTVQSSITYTLGANVENLALVTD